MSGESILNSQRAPELIRFVGESFRQLGFNKEAIEVYRKMLLKDMSPVDTQYVLLDMAESYLEEEDAFRARKTVDYLLARVKGSPIVDEFYAITAEIYMAEKKIALAREHFEKALKHDLAAEEITRLRLGLGELEFDQKNYSPAAINFRYACYFYKDFPNDSIPFRVQQAFVLLGDAEMAANNLTQAEFAYAQALSKFPEHPDKSRLTYLYGKAARKNGKNKEALTIRKDIAKQGDSDFWYELAQKEVKNLEWRLQNVNSINNAVVPSDEEPGNEGTNQAQQ